NNGLGPTKLISPFKIFQSSGNSSKLDALKVLPNLVSLSESDNNSPLLSTASLIDRNLYNVNIFSSLPGLSCLNITGDPNFFLITKFNTRKTGAKINNAESEIII